jgi:hypothetical protein
MRSAIRQLAAAIAAFALCASPAMATAATPNGIQPVSPLIAVSVFGTQASAQTICAQGSAAAAAAAQGQPGCVLPATDVAPPVAPDSPPPLATGNFGINWLLAGLGALFLVAGLATLFNDDDGDGIPVSAA